MDEKEEIINLNEEKIETQVLPILPLRGFVMFPRIALNFELSRDKSVIAIEDAMKLNQKVFIASQKDLTVEDPAGKDLYSVGVIADLKQIIHQQGEPVTRIFAEGLCRGKIEKFIDDPLCLKAEVSRCDEIECSKGPEVIALMRKARELFGVYLSAASRIPPDLIVGSKAHDDAGELSDYIASNSVIPVEFKQTILEELDTKKRLEFILEVLASEINIIQIESDIEEKLKESVDKGQKDYLLREQIKVIAKELGDISDPVTEAEVYKEKFRKLKLPKDILEKFNKECDKLARRPADSLEANIDRTYLETCLSLPWNKKTRDNINLKEAREILDRDHFGLKDVKDRIIEILAVRKLSKTLKGQIICLEGPPGVGKTSIAKSMASAMGRKYQRISLGGVRDEAEIRGHRRTYVGAMPGRIISAIKRSGVKNPLILLDEIDKLSSDYRGDPSSALLEVLDAEQNHTFYDHYIDVPFDLSEILFITTANDKNKIPGPLYDRMEFINLYSYTHEDKFNIAKNHLIPKQKKKNGLTDETFTISDEALRLLIDGYTREAGVRGLEKSLASLMRKAAKSIVSGEADSVSVSKDVLHDMLGPQRFKNDTLYKDNETGVVKGLAWTAVGGEVMPIEVALMKGKGKVQITGSLGDVMKESAQIAVSYIRSHSDSLGVKNDFYNKWDIHIHAPEGAIPKDGPSAGVTITTALLSALSGVPARQDVAMTGEVTLKGKVLPIGGLKEKTMAAYRDGVKTVIIPAENESDLEKIDDKVRESVNFIMADDLSTVFKNSLKLNGV